MSKSPRYLFRFVPRKNDHVYITPNYVGNGHWVISKDCLSNKTIFGSAELVKAAYNPLYVRDYPQENEKTLIPKQDEKTHVWKASSLLQEISYPKRTFGRLYRNETTGELVMFNSDYLKIPFKPNGFPMYLYGDSNRSSFTDFYTNPNFIIMPMRMTVDGIIMDYELFHEQLKEKKETKLVVPKNPTKKG